MKKAFLILIFLLVSSCKVFEVNKFSSRELPSSSSYYSPYYSLYKHYNYYHRYHNYTGPAKHYPKHKIR